MRQKQQLNAEKLRQEKVQLVVDGGVHTCASLHGPSLHARQGPAGRRVRLPFTPHCRLSDSEQPPSISDASLSCFRTARVQSSGRLTRINGLGRHSRDRTDRSVDGPPSAPVNLSCAEPATAINSAQARPDQMARNLNSRLEEVAMSCFRWPGSFLLQRIRGFHAQRH
jgi:hypothetical protein